MSFLQVPDPQNVSKPKSRQGIRRVYTSQNEQMPSQLSYQSIKLANFIQLQLTDLWDSLQQITEQNFKNQLKQSLSRSYNAFHEMKKLYNDLGMNFLYSQTKKLISSYGIIFVHLMQRVEKWEKKSQQIKSNNKQITKQQINPFQKQVKEAIVKITQNKQEKQIRSYKRMRGIHLFNQSYARCIDYDVEAFKQLREKIKQQQRTQQQKQIIKIQEQKKFNKQVVEQLNDFSHMKVDGQQLYIFLNRQRKINQISTKFTLQDELEKIAAFFKQSQHQALQFLRKQKNLQSFHQLTEGFNLIVSDYQNNKTQQLFLIQDKIKQVFQYINKKIKILQHIICEKQKQIQKLKELTINKQLLTSDAQTQTYHNFDDQIKQLVRRVVTTQNINEELKMLFKKTSQQDRKQKNAMLQQIAIKQSSCRQYRDIIQQKINYIVKIQRKIKILLENNKTKNIKDPIQFFNGLSDQMKRNFIQQLKQQGFLKSSKLQERKLSVNKNVKHTKISESIIDKKQQITNENKINQGGLRQLKKRQSSFFKRSSSRQWNIKDTSNQRKSGNLGFIQQKDYISSKQQTDRGTIVQEKQSSFKSKKYISVRQIQNESNVQKVRVFDIQDRIGIDYSQRFIQGDKNNASSKQIVKSSIQNSLKQLITQNNTQDNLLLEQPNQKSHKGIIKNIHKQEKIQNKSIKIDDNHKKRENEQVTQTQYKDNKQKMIQLPERQAQKLKVEFKDQMETLKQKYQSNQEQKKQVDKKKIICRSISRSQSKSRSRSRKVIRYEDQQNFCTNLKKQITQNQGQSQMDNKYNNQNKMQTSKIFDEQIKQQRSFRNEMSKSSKSTYKKRQRSKNRMKVYNQYNITINNTPLNSSKLIKSIDTFSRNKIDRRQKTKFNNDFVLNNATKRQIKQNNRFQQKSQMRSTTKKTNNNQVSPYLQLNSKDHDNRQTKTMIKNKENIRQNTQSLKNTFYINSKQKAHHRNRNSQILHNNNSKQSEEQVKKEQKQYIQHKLNNRISKILANQIKNNNRQSEAIKKLIQQEFEQEQIILASRLSATVQQFKQKVLKIHVKKCGENCKHLQRFLQIFMKLRKDSSTKRQLIKVHIQNMNEKLGQSFSNGFNLPIIRR